MGDLIKDGLGRAIGDPRRTQGLAQPSVTIQHPLTVWTVEQQRQRLIHQGLSREFILQQFGNQPLIEQQIHR